MDAAIAPIGLQPAAQRPIELDRVQPAKPAAQSSENRTSSFASEAADRQANRMNAQRSVERDTDTGSLVYRLVDLSTGIVTIQTPSDARLRLRAYIDGVISSTAEPAVEVRA